MTKNNKGRDRWNGATPKTTGRRNHTATDPLVGETLLSRLDGVRRTGTGRWIARCPAHDDRTPSLSIRELDDGRILLYCFGGCAVGDVLAAVGLDFDALFPERPIGDRKPERRPFAAIDALRCLAFEGLVVLLAAKDIRAGKALSDEDIERLAVAAARIDAALEVAA
jgi:hypothetical protein